MTRPVTPLAAAVEFEGALPVPFGHARPLGPAPRIKAADMPASRLEQRIRNLAAQQRNDRAAESAARMRAFLETAQSDTTPEEGTP
ncbi:hypothetical protein [Streptomyces sp. NPDC005303]|uniref:hypothetical protein n=1 Tax=Streptomyces sp. NPDC005303 TaxID=3155713 RepID=UPI0033BC58AC